MTTERPLNPPDPPSTYEASLVHHLTVEVSGIMPVGITATDLVQEVDEALAHDVTTGIEGEYIAEVGHKQKDRHLVATYIYRQPCVMMVEDDEMQSIPATITPDHLPGVWPGCHAKITKDELSFTMKP